MDAPSDTCTPSTCATPEDHEQEHVILVGISVTTPRGTRQDAMRWLAARLNEPAFRHLTMGPANGGPHVDSWWFAEDDRTDGSDCDSAVFIPYENNGVLPQGGARRILDAAYEMVQGGHSIEDVVAVIGLPVSDLPIGRFSAGDTIYAVDQEGATFVFPTAEAQEECRRHEDSLGAVDLRTFTCVAPRGMTFDEAADYACSHGPDRTSLNRPRCGWQRSTP